MSARFSLSGRKATSQAFARARRMSLSSRPAAGAATSYSGLVGPSGSGKSTMAQVLALLLEPDAGRLTVDGAPVGRWGLRSPRKLRHRVQLQRACLARALILEPNYLICDELGSMLDVSTQAALLEVISDEQEGRGLGVVLITHDRILADHWCHEMTELSANYYNPAGG